LLANFWFQKIISVVKSSRHLNNFIFAAQKLIPLKRFQSLLKKSFTPKNIQGKLRPVKLIAFNFYLKSHQTKIARLSISLRYPQKSGEKNRAIKVKHLIRLMAMRWEK
jgi:hypothetical protein